MSERARYRMELLYDGSGFRGWARQPGLLTVESALEDAFLTLLREPVRLTVAGRTDAGVHARRQVVSLDLPAGLDGSALLRSLNALTPPELVVRSLILARPGFDARRDATERSYRYFLWTAPAPNPFLARYSWHVPEPLDRSALAAAAGLFLGRHDLTAFTPSETEHVRFVRSIARCRWRFRGELAWLEVAAPSFMRHMVRILVGTMLQVGRGQRDLSSVQVLLSGARREHAGPTAPSQGLFLWRIGYADRGGQDGALGENVR